MAAGSRSRARWQSAATALKWPVPPVRGQCSLPHGHQLIDLAPVDLIGTAGLATQSARVDRKVVGKDPLVRTAILWGCARQGIGGVVHPDDAPAWVSNQLQLLASLRTTRGDEDVWANLAKAVGGGVGWRVGSHRLQLPVPPTKDELTPFGPPPSQSARKFGRRRVRGLPRGGIKGVLFDKLQDTCRQLANVHARC